MQQSYDKNSCKPGIKYFTSVNCWFTLVNWQFTTCKVVVYSKVAVYTCKPLLYKNETALATAAIYQKGRAIMEVTKKFFLTILSFEKYIEW